MTDHTERWLPVTEYEGLYEVSDLGRVRSLPRNTTRGKILSSSLSNGYPAVTLFRNGKRKRWLVHRLVLAAFTGPCPPGQEARHGPGGKLDERLENLCYGTRSENHLDKRRDGTSRCGEGNNKAKLTPDAVHEIRARAAEGVSQHVLASLFGVCQATISQVVRRKTWTHV